MCDNTASGSAEAGTRRPEQMAGLGDVSGSATSLTNDHNVRLTRPSLAWREAPPGSEESALSEEAAFQDISGSFMCV